MPTSHRFGFELEVSGGGYAALELMHEQGLVTDNHLHSYHCGKGSYRPCPACDPFRDGAPFTAQDDCTADAEFIAKVMHTHTAEADDAIAGIAAALVTARTEHNDEVGLHVHTDAAPFADNRPALIRLWRLWANYEQDIGLLARGAADWVRNYNSPVIGTGLRSYSGILGYSDNPHDETVRFMSATDDEAWRMMDDYVRTGPRTGRWLSGGVSSGTFEFRLWNSTRAEWRIRQAVYVSAALTVAALAGHDARPDDGLTLLDVIGDELPDDVYMSIFRQLSLTGV